MSEKTYKILQDKILTKLEEGVIPWQRTWSSTGGPAKNIISNKAYQGINYMMLNCQGYNSPYWMTYKQARSLGGFVTKGEKSSIISIFRPYKPKEDKDEEENEKYTRGYYGLAWVFNLAQTEDVKIPKREEDVVKKYDNEPIENCEQIVKEMRDMPEIIWGKAPCYIPSLDKIGMPKINKFIDATKYYAVLFHEMGHSTKALQRMNREKHSYAKEELIAEMTACFICGMVGIDTKIIDNAASYIKGWRDRIKKNDVKLVIQAASEAQKVANWIMNINEFTKLKEAA